MKAYDCYSVLEKLSAALVVFRADSAHEMTVCTIASIYTFIKKYVTVTCNLGHKQLLPRKSKIEVLRETTGPSHWDVHVLFTGGTLEHLLGTTFLYCRMYTLLTEGVQSYM